MIRVLKDINAGIAFLLELAMLIAFGYWGFYGDKSILLKWLLGIGVPLVVAIIWGIFLAPRANHRLNSVGGNLLSLFLFLLAAAALFYTQHPMLAITFALIAVMNRLLIVAWKLW